MKLIAFAKDIDTRLAGSGIGLGIALLPGMAVKSSLLNNSQLVAKELAAPTPKRVIALVARSSTAHTQEFNALANCIREQFGRT